MPIHADHVQTLVEMASAARLAVLYYRKGVTREALPARLVEPYSFAGGRQDLMVRCYQLEQDGDASASGWRFFMAHKIDRVEPTEIAYRPRRKVTLPAGELAEAAEPSPHWLEAGRRAYRDLVGDALADGKLHPSELDELARVVREHGLGPEDVRYVHASVYHRCLGSVLDDGFVTDQEVDQIRFLHRAMASLGWAVGD